MGECLDVTKDPIYQELLQLFPKASPEAVEISLQFMRVAAAMHLSQEKHFGRFGLTSGRYHLLMLLRREPTRNLSPSELAKRVKVTRATMTQFIDTLERDRLVARLDDPKDRRSTLVQLTSEGDALLNRILPDHLERLNVFSHALNRGERKQLFCLLEKLNQGLAEHEQATNP
jgi:DNA-binding MarR family transcriptional regulator